MDHGYPGPADPAVEYYWSLHPLRFIEVEWLELKRPVPWTNSSALTLHLRLRDPDNMNDALMLEFEGVEELSLSGGTQIVELTIVSLADRGWEYARYVADTGASPGLTLYCRSFTAELVPVESEPEE